MKYIRKPEVIDAELFDNTPEMAALYGLSRSGNKPTWFINDPDAPMAVYPGDMLIRYQTGVVSVMHSAVFKQLYELVAN